MNNKEIELKFGYDGKADNLFETFSKIGNVSAESEQHLDNTYFDTDDKDLFALKAGLRIRRADTFTEQTLKVKGENIGGLHKRVEYNLPLDDTAEVPNLLKFPKEAFPESFDVDSVQQKLKKVCHISFTRHLFNLFLLDSVFEVAYDRGFIEVNKIGSDTPVQYPLNELEIELKETTAKGDDLLNIFSILCTHLATNNLPLLLEPFSKMHRAALLQNSSHMLLNLSPFDTKSDATQVTEYIKNLVASFEQLYGYFIISKDITVFNLMTSVLEELLLSLKLLKKKNLPAFIRGQNEPVTYKQDLQIIYRLIKNFYKVCFHLKKKLLNAKLNGKDKAIEDLFKVVRESEKQNKMFLIPLKLRLLLSLIAS